MTTYYQPRSQITGLPSFYTRFDQRNGAQAEQAREESIQYQPYRTTPLVLAGAKMNKNNLPTESYLRYYPNPDIRAPPAHTFTDTLMKQKVQHKQFNSPIGLYSQDNIESTLKHTVPTEIPVVQTPSVQQHQQQQRPVANQKPHLQSKVQGYKKTVVFDPTTSATFKALNEQEEIHDGGFAEPKIYRPNRMVPGKKPVSSHPAPEPEFYKKVNTMGESTDVIHQSHSFKRLMYSVMGEMDA